MSLFARRKDKQIPKTPVTQDKALQNWLDSVGSILQKYIFGGGNDRLITAQELIDSGIAGQGNGGFITSPPKSLTKPPIVTNLEAAGSFGSIILTWTNPVFSNYGYTELLRADIDDAGQAVVIARTAVPSYIDSVGSAATKYYWVRAVSDQGVKGDLNASSGTKCQTSYNVDYVKQLLTSTKWQANTVYAPYQVVQPTTDNNYQYVVINGGKTASSEPTWPTIIGSTVNDGSVEWKAVPATDRLPLIVGELENGDPAVFIDTAYIKNASIESAKIKDLVVDKLTTGQLRANVELLSKLFAGFSEFANPSEQSGLWIGIDGDGKPKLKIDTGLANGNKYLVFDGENFYMNVDIVNSADGYFDDLSGDSVDFDRASFNFLAFGEHVTVSQYVYDNDISISEPEFKNYLCYPNGSRLTNNWLSPFLIVGTGYSRPFAFFQTGIYSGIYPYDYSNNTTKYRANKKNIGFSILIDAPQANSVGNFYGGSYLDIYILSEDQELTGQNYNSLNATDGIPSQYLLKIPVTYHADGAATAYKNTGSGDVSVFDVDIIIDKQINPRQTLIVCSDDLSVLDYKVGRSLKIAVVFKSFFQAGGSDDNTNTGQIAVYFQINSIAGEVNIHNSDSELSITAKAGEESQIATFTEAERNTLTQLIAWWNRPDPL